MRKLILAGTALVVIGVAAGGIAVTKAGAQPDPAALFMAPHDGQADAGLPPGAPQPMDDQPMVLAQNALSPGAEPAPPPPGMPGRPGPDGMRDGMAAHWRHMMMRRAAMFGLFFHPADKQLTAADVQKIAEAFLVWQGNRDWKVTQVAPAPDGKIGFAFATADGGVIARFTMDSKTGRLARVA